MRTAFVGLGSNLDQPALRVREALDQLAKLPSTRLHSTSRMFKTPPWGQLDQPGFVNAVARLDTALAPLALLDALLMIERGMGRERLQRWGPRRIDLDLLHMDGQTHRCERLTLPHPRIAERGFVLLPWLDLDPRADISGVGHLPSLAARVDCSGIEPLP